METLKQTNNRRVFLYVALAAVIILLQIFISLRNLDIAARSSYLAASLDYYSSQLGSSYERTKDVAIIPIHSHNDEWRQVPFLSAYKTGAQSIEVDVWSFKTETLYVGHNENYLSAQFTLQSLYLDQIADILSDANSRTTQNDKPNGVFYDNPDATLYLYIDIKSANSSRTFQHLESALEDFRSRDWLTFYNDTTNSLTQRPLTVIITGNFPLQDIANQSNRFFFVDAPLADIASSTADFVAKYKPGQLSLTCSASLKQLISHSSSTLAEAVAAAEISMSMGLNEEQLIDLDMTYVVPAHDNGLKVRIWDTPGWPKRLRNVIWLQLLESGVDLLNVDDLKGALELF